MIQPPLATGRKTPKSLVAILEPSAMRRLVLPSVRQPGRNGGPIAFLAAKAARSRRPHQEGGQENHGDDARVDLKGRAETTGGVAKHTAKRRSEGRYRPDQAGQGENLKVMLATEVVEQQHRH